ncbi:hypothetical protein M758_1G040200 [Ceratodon purpureus]|nr:hypothetical protein M758_1G040200 [Ceratodon purpureus]
MFKGSWIYEDFRAASKMFEKKGFAPGWRWWAAGGARNVLRPCRARNLVDQVNRYEEIIQGCCLSLNSSTRYTLPHLLATLACIVEEHGRAHEFNENRYSSTGLCSKMNGGSLHVF